MHIIYPLTYDLGCSYKMLLRFEAKFLAKQELNFFWIVNIIQLIPPLLHLTTI